MATPAVASVLPSASSPYPPIVLVHGAANSALVWTHSQRELSTRGWASRAVDLRGHGCSEHTDLSNTGLRDYAADVGSAINLLDRPLNVLGWSTGGLVALMVAAAGDAVACVAMAPSLPTRETDASARLRRGEFGPEESGFASTSPADQQGMPDLDFALIHRRTACRRPAEETKGCVSESGIMVLKQKTGPTKGAPDSCYHVTTPTASNSPSTTTAWWPMQG